MVSTKASRSILQRGRVRRTRRVLDRQGRPAQMITLKDVREHTGTVLRQVDKYGAVAISKAGKPIAVALAPDYFVAICVAYTIAVTRRRSLNAPS